MASGRVIALESGSKAEEKRGVDDCDQQDGYKGGEELRKGGRVLAAISRGACLKFEVSRKLETILW